MTVHDWTGDWLCAVLIGTILSGGVPAVVQTNK
jgi:hypothetical protein